MFLVYVRRTLARLGLTGLARTALMYLVADRRELSVGGEWARFHHETFGDHIEINQAEAETAILRRIRDDVRPSDVFLDVGSNLGIYAVFVGKALESGRVVAVEAVPSTAETLRRNISLNGVDATVANVAFGDDSGMVSMQVPDSHGSSAIASDGDVDVTCVRGDSYLDRSSLPTPTVVKIDVEGYELAVVRGLRESLRAPDCRIVYCEVHPDRLREFGGSAAELETTLTDWGFDLDRIADLPGGRYIVRGVKSGER